VFSIHGPPGSMGRAPDVQRMSAGGRLAGRLTPALAAPRWRRYAAAPAGLKSSTAASNTIPSGAKAARNVSDTYPGDRCA
jgi:hypothetical protein